jgi:hypothetical protein
MDAEEESFVLALMQSSLVQSTRSSSLIFCGSSGAGFDACGWNIGMERDRPGDVGGLDGGEYSEEE